METGLANAFGIRKILYKTAKQGIDLKWSGPGIKKTNLNSELYHLSLDSVFVNGLKYCYYRGYWTALPNFDSTNPIKTEITLKVVYAHSFKIPDEPKEDLPVYWSLLGKKPYYSI